MSDSQSAGFARRFAPGPDRGEPWINEVLWRSGAYADFSQQWAGTTFERGLYRFVDNVSGPQLTGLVAEAFPEFAARAHPFGYDWLGRSFAVDTGRLVSNEPLILLLEPGTGKALEIPYSFAAFHEELDDLRESALAASFYGAWSKAQPRSLPLPRSACVGYQVPLFLGGNDTIDNLEVQDLDVYWSLCAQLYRGSLMLPPGTRIKALRIDHRGDP